MGYDAVRGIGTYGRGCMPGCARQFAWWQRTYQAGSLGCYNPASVASGGPSLHAEGRAMDIALNANDPAQRARGDQIVARVVASPEQFGAQEMLWRGGVWSWRNRHLGWRQNGTQQAAHMNHVHLGLDVNAATSWTEAWVGAAPAAPSAPRPKDDSMYFLKDINAIANDAQHYWEVMGLTWRKVGNLEGAYVKAHADAGVPVYSMPADVIKLHLGSLDVQRKSLVTQINASGGTGTSGPSGPVALTPETVATLVKAVNDDAAARLKS